MMHPTFPPQATGQLASSATLPLPRAVLLHLFPGVCTLIAYTALAASLVPRGLPQMLALMFAILLVEVPVCWVIMVRLVRRQTARGFDARVAFPWLDRVPLRIYALIGVPLLLFSVIMIGGVGPALEEPLTAGLFAWVPDWFVMRADPSTFTSLSRGTLLLIWALSLIGLTLLGGVTQELYFRGYLLPRMIDFGRAAPAFNAGLFAIFHFIAPWSWPVFFLMTLPWAYVVWWRRSVKIGLFIHVGMLFLQWLMMTLIVFGVVKFPAA